MVFSLFLAAWPILHAAPTARNMIARGKREARRPWLINQKRVGGLKGRNSRRRISSLQDSNRFCCVYQGRRAPLRFALAPGYHISRLWRLRLNLDISRLWRLGLNLDISRLWRLGLNLDISRLWRLRLNLDISRLWRLRLNLDISRLWRSASLSLRGTSIVDRRSNNPSC